LLLALEILNVRVFNLTREWQSIVDAIMSRAVFEREFEIVYLHFLMVNYCTIIYIEHNYGLGIYLLKYFKCFLNFVNVEI